MVVLTYVTPITDWWTTLTTIPNDGNDHEIVFMGGVYSTPPTAVTDTFEIDHTAGGSITLRAALSGTVTINQTTTNQNIIFYFVCDKFRMNGIEWRCITYFNTINGTGPAVSVGNNFTMHIGGVGSGTSNRINMTLCEITECKWFGARNTLQIHVSSSPLYYTNVHLENLDIKESGTNYTLLVTQSGVFLTDEAYCHVQARGITHTGINGPNSLAEYPSDPNAVAFSSHNNGTGCLSFAHFGGHSTVVVSEYVSSCEIQGSFNHDLHSMSINFIWSKDVTLNIKDSTFHGLWSKGSIHGIGVSNKFMHMFYYHFTNVNDYPVLGERPVLTFENVLFETRIAQGVDNDLFSSNPKHPPRELLWTNASASYQFYDCTFRWIVENPLYDNATLTGIGEKSNNIDVHTHNCKFEIAANGVSYRPEGRSGATYIDDTESRGYRDEKWLRIYALDRIKRENMLGASSFESQVSIP